MMSQDEINVGLFEEVKKLRNELDKVTVERDLFKETARQYTELASRGIYYTIAELDVFRLEQQAKAVESVRKYCVQMKRKQGSKWLMVDAIWYLQDTEKELRKQAEEL